MIGTTIRKFEILSELGAGGYGAVYRAHDTEVNRDVAIKVILPQYADNPDFKQRFEAEAQTVAKLENPRIVPLYDYWQDEQGAFLVMRLIRGGSLRRIMAKQETLSLAQTIRILSDIAEALVVAHENGVVHRDLKPENILIDERGNAYLTDFGIAKQTGETKNITETDAIVGTWAYLSPEQIQNIEVTPQTDIYAFGIMLYEMLAGKHPFQDTPATMMVMKHLQEHLPDLSELRPDLPYELNEIIHKATSKEPSQRYESAIDLITDLKSAVNESSPRSTSIPQPLPRKKATTTEERNRYAMLENVRKFWIEGVLENSVHEAAMIDLGMTSKAGAVDNPWGSVLRTPSGDETIIDDHILNIFERLNGKLLIMGDPGSGKTTTLLTLASELLFRAEFDDAHPIPVIFNLSSWSERQQPLTEWLVEELNAKYQVPRKVGEKWVADDELLLLLDGLDEVTENARDACVQTINTYREEHGFVDVVVCSRITDYDTLNNQLRLNGAMVIQPLDDSQIIEYLNQLGNDAQVVRDLIIRDAQLRELAYTPLMLSIMVLAYRGKSASDIPDFADIEQQRKHLFNVYVERMFERRGKANVYSPQETRHYLSWLARQMQEHAKTVFHLEELQPFNQPHEVKSRYLTIIRALQIIGNTSTNTIALWIVSAGLPVETLPFVIGNALIFLALGVVFISQPRIWKNIIPHLVIGGIFGALVWSLTAQPLALYMTVIVAIIGFSNTGIASYVVSMIFAQTNFNLLQIIPKEHLTLSFKEVKPLVVVAALASSIVPTILTASWVNPQGGWGNWLLGAVFAGIGYGLLVTISTSLVSQKLSSHVTPNQGIHESLRTSLRIAGLIMPIFFITFMAGIPAVGVKTGVALAIGYTIGFSAIIWWAYGGLVYLQHHILRRMLHQFDYLPYDLVGFLDYASSLILLRKVGGGYIFIHRYLLEYFAELETDDGE